MPKYRLPDPKNLHITSMLEFARTIQDIMFTRNGPDKVVVVDPDNEVSGADVTAQILEALRNHDLDPVEIVQADAPTRVVQYARFTDIVTHYGERERFAEEVSESVDGTWGDNCHSLVYWEQLQQLLDKHGFDYCKPSSGVRFVDMEN